ncbi:MAG: DUF4337 domain-containing protein [Candidatus Omnitrophica bacterium]|nr:DUF4337 domain-containing protein [Candidatus Omnitrophota bacterium]
MADILPEKWMKGVAITTTVLAVIASIASSRSAFFIAKAQLLTAREGSQWSYYQAKSVKQNLVQAQQVTFKSNILGATTPEQKEFLTQNLKNYESDIARYEEEKTAIKKEAENIGKENGIVVRKGSQFSLAVVFSQIGIMLSSVGALLRRKEMWITGIIIGAFSLVFTANGFLLLF